MTKRQRLLHDRLRQEAPQLYQEAEKSLASLPIGCSARIRIPMQFQIGSVMPLSWSIVLIVTKTPRGLEYIEETPGWQKGWAAPRPRLLPMLPTKPADTRSSDGPA